MKKKSLLRGAKCLMVGVAFFSLAFTSSCCNEEKDMNVATLETSHGDITIVLLNETPLHRDNFIRLVESDYYNGMKYHRVIEGFIIQIGDPKTKDPSYPKENYGGDGEEPLIKAEIVRSAIHTRGAVSTGRQNDDTNPERKSSGSHYSIMTGNDTTTAEKLEKVAQKSGYTYTEEEIEIYLKNGGAPHLDAFYVAFGYVLEGMDTVKIIETAEKNEKDNPIGDYYIKDIKLTKMSKEEIAEKYKNSTWVQ